MQNNKFILNNKIIVVDSSKYIKSVERHIEQCHVYDWKCDYVNNNITESLNIQETEYVNTILENILLNYYILNRYSCLKLKVFFEIKNTIYMSLAWQICEKLILDIFEFKKDYSVKYSHISTEDINMFGLIGFELYLTNFVKNSTIIIDLENNKKIYIDEYTNMWSKNWSKIDNYIYCKKIANTLKIYTFNETELEPKIKEINLEIYGEILDLFNLEQKIYLFMQKERKYILIYDISSDSMQIDYSFNANFDCTSQYYGIFICHNKKSNSDVEKCAIYTIKPAIKKMNIFDMCFKFE